MKKALIIFLIILLNMLAFAQNELRNIQQIREFVLKANSVYGNNIKKSKQANRFRLAKKKPIVRDRNSGLEHFLVNNDVNTLDKAMGKYGEYFTRRVAEFEIQRSRRTYVFWGKLSPVDGIGDHDVIIMDKSPFKLTHNGADKKIVQITGIDDDNGGETKNLTYTIEKLNGRWLITDEVGYHPSIERRHQITNKYYEKIYITWNATASSELPSHPAKYIQDKKLYTVWSENVSGNGKGEWIKFVSPEDECFIELEIVNGYAKNKALYQANNRVKKLRIEFDEGQVIERELKDNELGYQKIEFGDMIVSRWVKVTILDTYQGTKYDDTCVSEVRFY